MSRQMVELAEIVPITLMGTCANSVSEQAHAMS